MGTLSCEDRIRTVKDTRLTDSLCTGSTRTASALAIAQRAVDRSVWTRRKPKHARYQAFSVTAHIAAYDSHTHLRLSKTATWSALIMTARLAAFPAPA